MIKKNQSDTSKDVKSALFADPVHFDRIRVRLLKNSDPDPVPVLDPDPGLEPA
jgi:hypothetical protein